MKKILVIYHKNCLDGFGAAWAAWRKFGSRAEYYPAEHGALPPEVKGRDVYIVDFSYKAPVMKDILKAAKNVTIIDHHISAKDVVKIVPNKSYSMDHSGATLTWSYLHPGEKTPKLLLHIEDVDLWKFKMKHTREVACVMELHLFDFNIWNKIARHLDNPKTAKAYIDKGKAILEYKATLIKRAVDKSLDAVFHGHKAKIVNSMFFQSEIGNALVKAGAEVGIIYSQSGEKIKVSLRSNGKVNVAKLSEKYGGGGHKAAAGFAISSGEKSPWEIIEEE